MCFETNKLFFPLNSVAKIRALEYLEPLKIFLEDRGPFSEKKGKFKTFHILNRKEMYQFYLKISKINEKVNKTFISPETLTSYFDAKLNKRDAGQAGCIPCMVVFLPRFNVSGCQKMISESKYYLSTTIEHLT